MPSIVETLYKRGRLKPPQWLPANVHYETMMGSIAYGVSDKVSDVDVYGFCIPPKDMIFPHLRGEIPGFGKQQGRFEQYQEQHVDLADSEYDVSIYSIVKYFQLCMENNPNMVDSLFTPFNCVLSITSIGQLVRDNRDMFLHKGYYHKARGYAFSQLSKMKHTEATHGKRRELIDTYGYDIKFAYHVVRLLDQTEQVLSTGTLDLQRSRKVLKSIRAGEWSEQQVRDYFDREERRLEDLYHSSDLRYSPDERAIKELLLNCLESHYGSLASVINLGDRQNDAFYRIIEIASAALGR